MKKNRPLAPKGGNDNVMTPPKLAHRIISHFKVDGKVIDPCRGEGAFWTPGWAWCEISEGQDFLTTDFSGRHFDYICSNPPWSQIRAFTKKAMEISDNVIWLCLVNAFWMKARLRDMNEAGFGIKEILFVDTPAKPWPQTGFQLGATHIQRGYKGPVTINRL